MTSRADRVQHEIAHGRFMIKADPEWCWNSPAGRVRAERRAQLIASGAGLRSGMQVLEVGCGTGLFTTMFAMSGAHVCAIDVSPELLTIARGRALPASVRFEACTLEDFEADEPFDAVIGSSVLHHLDLTVALRRLFDLLKPGGVLAFAEPNMLNPQVFLERRFRRFFPLVSPDETAFVRTPLSRALADVGFAELTITPFDWLHPATPQLLVRPVSFVGSMLERWPVAREFAGSLYIRAVRR